MNILDHLKHLQRTVLLKNMGGSSGDVSEKSCDVGEAKEGLENEL